MSVREDDFSSASDPASKSGDGVTSTKIADLQPDAEGAARARLSALAAEAYGQGLDGAGLRLALKALDGPDRSNDGPASFVEREMQRREAATKSGPKPPPLP